ncbi:hypothetical protein [Niastella yeongjuensis]|uniref:hypothetical protein n=1 Tax=Niastella yeongjuensis TaxID=354355 RepID=UPI0015A5AF33|nr:hypothetical protein [Niastella yeongjuensis]
MDLAEQQLMRIGSSHVHGDVMGMDTVMVNTIPGLTSGVNRTVLLPVFLRAMNN